MGLLTPFWWKGKLAVWMESNVLVIVPKSGTGEIKVLENPFRRKSSA
jgi:hypothetical protein